MPRIWSNAARSVACSRCSASGLTAYRNRVVLRGFFRRRNTEESSATSAVTNSSSSSLFPARPMRRSPTPPWRIMRIPTRRSSRISGRRRSWATTARRTTSASTGSRPPDSGTWGDGRTVILGTQGYIELRKYVDVGREATGDHVYLVDQKGEHHLPVAGKDRLSLLRRANPRLPESDGESDDAGPRASRRPSSACGLKPRPNESPNQRPGCSARVTRLGDQT